MRRMRAISVLVVLLGWSCADPYEPTVGIPTLDDPLVDNFVSVSAGREHTCALAADGSAFCWGSNEFGQLGLADNGTTCARAESPVPCRTSPAPVSGGLKFQKITAGGNHSCGLALDNHIYCWGDNLRGQLGDPLIRRSPTPILIPSTTLFMDAAAGGTHTCGLRGDGVLLCWGANDQGQLGIATSDLGTATPTSVRTNQRFASVVAGKSRTCARTRIGEAYCWGQTWVSSAETREVTREQTTPARVLSAPAFMSLAAGTTSTCGVSAQAQTYCWEANTVGGIGDGTIMGSTVPVAVTSTERWVAISSGADQTCGIAETGFAYCWGGNSSGQLGVSPSVISTRCGYYGTPCSTVPIRVSGWRTFSQISAGQGGHGCGVTVGGNVYCWGAGGMGQRGEGRTSSAEWSPVKTRSP